MIAKQLENSESQIPLTASSSDTQEHRKLEHGFVSEQAFTQMNDRIIFIAVASANGYAGFTNIHGLIEESQIFEEENIDKCTMQVMSDVNKYIEHMEDEEKRSHPFGVTNVLLNGLNGRKSKTSLDTGRCLTWICFFCLVIGLCTTVIYLSARAANKAKTENCTLYNLCDTTIPPHETKSTLLTNEKPSHLSPTLENITPTEHSHEPPTPSNSTQEKTTHSTTISLTSTMKAMARKRRNPQLFKMRFNRLR